MIRKLLLGAGAILILGGAGSATVAEPAAHVVKVRMLCFKTGENQAGMNKICYYDCGGSEATRTVASAQLCPMNVQEGGAARRDDSNPYSRPSRPQPRAEPTCIRQGEYISGSLKNCVYSCAGSERYLTVGAYQNCPINPRG